MDGLRGIRSLLARVSTCGVVEDAHVIELVYLHTH